MGAKQKNREVGGGEGGKKPDLSLLYTGGTYSKILRLNLEVHGTCYVRLFEFGGLAAWSLVLKTTRLQHLFEKCFRCLRFPLPT